MTSRLTSSLYNPSSAGGSQTESAKAASLGLPCPMATEIPVARSMGMSFSPSPKPMLLHLGMPSHRFRP